MDKARFAMQVISTICLLYISGKLAALNISPLGNVVVEGYVSIGNGQRSPVPVEVMKPIEVYVQR